MATFSLVCRWMIGTLVLVWAIVPSGFASAAQVPAPVVSVVDQPIVNNTVTAAEVVAPGDGWIAAHAFEADGKLIINQVVGVAQVPAGRSTDVAVRLTESFKPGDTLVLMLHVNEAPKDSFDFPGGGDEAVVLNGQIVLQQFRVLDAAAPAATMPDTGALPLQLAAIVAVAGVVLVNGYLLRRRALKAR